MRDVPTSKQYPSSAAPVSRFRFLGLIGPFLVLAIVAACIVLFAVHGYPVPDGDAAFYWPPMLSLANMGNLVNDFGPHSFRPLMAEIDDTGQNRFLYHGYLYQLLIGRLAWKADYSVLELLIGIVNVVTLSGTTLLLIRVFRASNARSAIARFVVITTAIPACAVTLIGHSGRNETLGAGILVFGLLGILSATSRWHSAICGVAIGLLAASHPAGCILTGLGMGLFAFYLMRFREGVLFLLRVGVIGVVVWSLTFAFYPYPLHDWLFGLATMTKTVTTQPVGMNADIWYRWIINPAAAGYGLIYMVAGAAGFYCVVKYWKKIACKVPFGICGMLLLGAVVNYGIRNPAQNYNLLLFAPLVFAFIIWFAGCQPAPEARVRSLFLWVATFCFLAASAGFVRTVLVFPYFLHDGLGRDVAKHEIDLVKNKYGGTIGLSNGLFTLTGEYQRTKGMEINDGPIYDTFVLQQANRGKTIPPEIDGYDMVEDRFSRVQPHLFGVKIGNTVPAYNFAVYRRKGAVPQGK